MLLIEITSSALRQSTNYLGSGYCLFASSARAVCCYTMSSRHYVYVYVMCIMHEQEKREVRVMMKGLHKKRVDPEAGQEVRGVRQEVVVDTRDRDTRSRSAIKEDLLSIFEGISLFLLLQSLAAFFSREVEAGETLH